MKRLCALLLCCTALAQAQQTVLPGPPTLPDSPESHLPAAPGPEWHAVAMLHPGDSIAVLDRGHNGPTRCHVVAVGDDTLTCRPWEQQWPDGEVSGPMPRIVFPRASIVTVWTERQAKAPTATPLIAMGAVIGTCTIVGGVTGGSSGAAGGALVGFLISGIVVLSNPHTYELHERTVRRILYQAPPA